jgi:flagellar capping protein FliD
VVNQVSALVSAANQVLSTISTDTAYDESTNTAAPLNGQTSLTELAQQVLSIVGHAVGASGAGSDGTAGESAGLAITSSGTITFNQAPSKSAYDKNPSAVQAMFTEGGTFSSSSPSYDGQVSVAGATDEHDSPATTQSRSASRRPRRYRHRNRRRSPHRLRPMGAAESYTVTSGSNFRHLRDQAGESMADVMSGLNGAWPRPAAVSRLR